jgi:hypothetical protein
VPSERTEGPNFTKPAYSSEESRLFFPKQLIKNFHHFEILLTDLPDQKSTSLSSLGKSEGNALNILKREREEGNTFFFFWPGLGVKEVKKKGDLKKGLKNCLQGKYLKMLVIVN